MFRSFRIPFLVGKLLVWTFGDVFVEIGLSLCLLNFGLNIFECT